LLLPLIEFILADIAIPINQIPQRDFQCATSVESREHPGLLRGRRFVVLPRVGSILLDNCNHKQFVTLDPWTTSNG
jgi:hypothetical protein